MIKIILIFLITTIVYANDIKKASSIFNMIIKSITQKENPNVYLHTEIKALQQYPHELNIVGNCNKADIVILSTTKDIPLECKGKILFGTRYSHLKDNNVVGAFFWQKGRPNILFYQQELNKYNIRLDSSFDKYIEK